MSKRKSETDTVTIRVHPAVRRWFENTFPKVGGAYDLRGHFLHDFLRAGLTKEPQGRREPSPLPEVKVAVSRRENILQVQKDEKSVFVLFVMFL